MSAKRWKQIITIVVCLMILVATSLAVIFGIKYGQLLNGTRPAREMVTALENEGLTQQEFLGMLKYLRALEVDDDLEYKNKYKQLHVDNDFVFDEPDGKVCYLTFDDGPNETVTPQVLDVLKEYNVKATFFVVYNKSEEAKKLYKRIVDEGHAIGIHTASHNYEKIYSSVDEYLKDFNKVEKYVRKVTGVKPEIFRFPGGSVNSYNLSTYERISKEMLRRGYTYYDWNASSGDAAGPRVSAARIRENSLNQSRRENKRIILMHDGGGHQNTATALPGIIKGLKKQGCTFAPLTKDVKPIVFG